MFSQPPNPLEAMTTQLRSSFISNGSLWQEIAAFFVDHNLWDIYFDSAYVSLYQGGDESKRVEAYCYEADGNRFFLPYLKAPIPGFPGLWDFQTAYGYGGPLATTDDPQFLSAAWAEFEREARSHGVICGLLRFHPLLNTTRYATRPVSIISDRDTVWLDLHRRFEDIYTDYSKENRRKLKKATREGVSVEVCTGRDSLSKFASLYVARMSELRARSDYFFDEEYFSSIDALGADGYRVYLCYSKCRELVGGALILLSTDYVHYHLSAARKEWFHLSPNNVLRDSVIRDYVGGGRSAIHFGGGLTSDPSDSLLAFKLNFSRQRLRFHTGTCVLDTERYEAVRNEWLSRVEAERQERFGGFIQCYRY